MSLRRSFVFLIVIVLALASPAGAQPYPCTNRAADSVAARSGTTVGVRASAIGRLLVCYDSANARVASAQTAGLNAHLANISARLDSLLRRGTTAPPADTVADPPPDSTPVPPPVSGVPATTVNRPANLTTVTDYDGGTNMTGLWFVHSQVTLQQDANAPKSPGAVRRFALRQLSNGEGTTEGIHVRQGLGYREIYVARWLKPSAGIYGTDLGSKSMYVNDMNSNKILYINWENGVGGVAGDVYMKPAGACSGGNWLPRNRPGPGIKLDTWALAEVYLSLDGILRLWTNGQLTHEYSVTCPAGALIGNVEVDFYQNGWGGTMPYPFNPGAFDAARWNWLLDHLVVAGR